MEITEIIKENLEKLDEDYDILKPFMQKWLIKIEESIQTKRKSQTEAESILKNMDYTVKSIAEDVGASRTTLYNHEQLLKRYIEISSSMAESSNPYIKIKQIQAEKSIMQEQMNKLMLRDVDIELLKIQLQSLNSILENKNREIKRLESRIMELSDENRKLKLTGTSSNRIGTPFKKK